MIRPDPSDAIEAAHPVSSTTPNKRRHWTIRRLIVTVGIIAFLFRAYMVLGEIAHEPYAWAFNSNHLRTADEAHLIGRPEADVLAVLCKPRSVQAYDAGNGIAGKTFQYTHSTSCSGRFQVHCEQGIVRRMEQVDN